MLLLVHGFHMVIIARSYTRKEKMAVSQELCYYFPELIQPLGTNVCLEQMFLKQEMFLKEEIITKSEERFNRKVDELTERVAFQDNTINQLLIKCDNNE